jgi:general secretion pathway protein E
MVMLEAGEILFRRGLLDAEQLDKLRSQAVGAGDLLAAAIGQGMVEEEPALRALGEELGMEFIDLRNAEVDLDVVKAFPQKLIYRHSLFPLSRINGSLTLATSEPLDVYALDEASAATGLTIVPVVAEKSEIARLAKKHLGVGSETVEGLIAAEEDDAIQLLEEIETDGSELSEMAQEASVVRWSTKFCSKRSIAHPVTCTSNRSQRIGDSLSHRRHLHTQPDAAGNQSLSSRHHQPFEDHGAAEHRRKRLPQDGRIKLRVHGRESTFVCR